MVTHNLGTSKDRESVALRDSTSTMKNDPSRNPAISVLLLAVGLVVALIAAWLGRFILLLLFAATVLAILLTSVVGWVKAKLQIGRRLAFALIVLPAITLIAITLWISGPNIAEQFASLQADLPKAIQ